MGKYSQLVLEMEKLAPAFADDTDRQPHVAYGGDDYENPEEAFSDEDATRRPRRSGAPIAATADSLGQPCDFSITMAGTTKKREPPSTPMPGVC